MVQSQIRCPLSQWFTPGADYILIIPIALCIIQFVDSLLKKKVLIEGSRTLGFLLPSHAPSPNPNWEMRLLGEPNLQLDGSVGKKPGLTIYRPQVRASLLAGCFSCLGL